MACGMHWTRGRINGSNTSVIKPIRREQAPLLSRGGEGCAVKRCREATPPRPLQQGSFAASFLGRGHPSSAEEGSFYGASVKSRPRVSGPSQISIAEHDNETAIGTVIAL